MEPLNLAALKARNTVRKAVLGPGPWTKGLGPGFSARRGPARGATHRCPVAAGPQPAVRLFLVGARNDCVEADVDAGIRRGEEREARAAGSAR